MTTNQEKLNKIQRVTNAINEIIKTEEKADRELTADQLAARYSPAGHGEHPRHTRGTWRDEVFNDHTLLGYWDWVAHQLHDEYIHNDPH